MGTKRSLLVDKSGLPLSVVLDGANRRDIKLLEATLDGMVVVRPEPTPEQPQNISLDAAYVGDDVNDGNEWNLYFQYREALSFLHGSGRIHRNNYFPG